jgi:F0F1-type ATP synthase assembly protein I
LIANDRALPCGVATYSACLFTCHVVALLWAAPYNVRASSGANQGGLLAPVQLGGKLARRWPVILPQTMREGTFRSLPFRIVVIQSGIGVVAAALLLLVSAGAAAAALAASLAIVAPNAWFAWRLSRPTRKWLQLDVPAQARLTLMQGALRTLFTVLLLVALVVWIRPEPLAFIGTLLLLQGAYFIAALTEQSGSGED